MCGTTIARNGPMLLLALALGACAGLHELYQIDAVAESCAA